MAKNRNDTATHTPNILWNEYGNYVPSDSLTAHKHGWALFVITTASFDTLEGTALGSTARVSWSMHAAHCVLFVHLLAEKMHGFA